ncbi:MAG: peptidase U32 family protein [bacterium]
MQSINLMAPAGSWESLQSAVKAGANSVYFGINQFNMRANTSTSFDISDLDQISALCKKNKIQSYLVLNTLVYDDEISDLEKICRQAKKAKLNAVIASDWAAIQAARKHDLEVHISTQANISNLKAVKFFAEYCNVIILARELSLEQIASICSEIKKQNIRGPGGDLIKIEVFIHGALCVSISGKCYMSLALYNQSANRGSCIQPCRRSYTVTDDQTGEQLRINNKYIMSPRDLCTIGMIDKLIQAGISVLKIEGRGRAADYVYKVTKAYREAVDSVKNGTYTKEKIKKWTESFKSVYNRNFWQGGYYLGHKMSEWAASYGSQSSLKKLYVGKVTNYFGKSQIGEFLIEDNEIKIEDMIMVTGTTTGYAETVVKSLFKDDKPVTTATKGSIVTIPFSEKIRRNDKIYVFKKRFEPFTP